LERFSSSPERDNIMMALEDQEIELESGVEELSPLALVLDKDTVETLCSIVEWLVRTEDHSQCLKTYIKVRQLRNTGSIGSSAPIVAQCYC
jgi:hypothetical protein